MSQSKQSHSVVNCVDVHQRLHEEYVRKVHESGHPLWMLDLYSHAQHYQSLQGGVEGEEHRLLGSGEVVENIHPPHPKQDLPF